MPERNIEAAKRTWDAFNRRDAAAMMEDCSQDFVLVPGRSVLSGEFHGEAGLRRYFEDTAETFAVFAVRMDEIHGAGDRVVVIGTLRIRPFGGGPEADVPTAILYTFSAGKLIRAEDLRERDVALRAAGFDA